MPARIDEETRGKIVQMRALDYDKQEIAQELGISRNTVSRHLKEVREEAEKGDQESVVLDAIAAGILGAGVGYLIAKTIKNLANEGAVEDAYLGNPRANEPSLDIREFT